MIVNIMSTDNTSATPLMLYTGRVKWFNNKAGYGFITVVSTPSDSSIEKNSDVFAHHSSIQVSEEQYRYLVQGEYVQFNLSTVEESEHKYQANTISGISGGQLLCETRNEIRVNAPRRQPPRTPRDGPDRRPQYRGTGPRDGGGGEKEEWVLTKRSSTTRRPQMKDNHTNSR